MGGVGIVINKIGCVGSACVGYLAGDKISRVHHHISKYADVKNIYITVAYGLNAYCSFFSISINRFLAEFTSLIMNLFGGMET